jgi:hypothetical protein
MFSVESWFLNETAFISLSSAPSPSDAFFSEREEVTPSETMSDSEFLIPSESFRTSAFIISENFVYTLWSNYNDRPLTEGSELTMTEAFFDSHNPFMYTEGLAETEIYSSSDFTLSSQLSVSASFLESHGSNVTLTFTSMGRISATSNIVVTGSLSESEDLPVPITEVFQDNVTDTFSSLLLFTSTVMFTGTNDLAVTEDLNVSEKVVQTMALRYTEASESASVWGYIAGILVLVTVGSAFLIRELVIVYDAVNEINALNSSNDEELISDENPIVEKEEEGE